MKGKYQLYRKNIKQKKVKYRKACQISTMHRVAMAAPGQSSTVLLKQFKKYSIQDILQNCFKMHSSSVGVQQCASVKLPSAKLEQFIPRQKMNPVKEPRHSEAKFAIFPKP